MNYWFRANRPDYVFLVAGTVGGIMANATRPAEFLYDNMLIHGTVVHASHLYAVTKLLYLGSSCVYPRAAQPITEDQLLTGPLEPTNEAYAVAKIAGIKLCESYRAQYGDDFVTALPTNVYGPNDNFDPEGGHLVPMLIRRFHEAKVAGDGAVTVWGTGAPRRELLHVDDLADVPAPDVPLRPAGSDQRGHGRRPHGARHRGAPSGTWSTPAPSSSSTRRSPTACPARSSTCRGSTRSAGATPSSSTPGCAPPTSGTGRPTGSAASGTGRPAPP